MDLVGDLFGVLEDELEPSVSTAEFPEVPAGFVDFCEWLGVELFPAQRVLCKVAFDGAEPCDLVGEERELARQLLGDIERVPPAARAVLVVVCGGRSGKTYVFGALKLLHAALTVSLAAMAPGEEAVAVMVGPHLKHAHQCLKYVKGAIGMRGDVAALVVRENLQQVVIQRPDGRVTIECRAASSKGVAGRGFSYVFALLDECAFFQGEDKVVNDKEIEKAIAPRILRGGQLVLASTPDAEMGLLYERFTQNHGKPDTALAAHAPTLLMNPSKTEEVERERKNDPDNARREFDAEFVAAGTAAMFDARAIRASLSDQPVPRLPSQYAKLAVGADFGFRTDASAMVIVELMPDRTYHVMDIAEIQPVKGPLRPSEVVSEFAKSMLQAGHDTMIADNHYRESIVEELLKHGMYLTSAPEGQSGKAEAYNKTKIIMNEGRLRVPDHPRLMRQLREVTKTPTGGGGIKIESPRWRTGGHGDIVTALVWAVHALSKLEPKAEDVEALPLTPEWHRQREQKRKERKRREYLDAQSEAANNENSWILGPP